VIANVFLLAYRRQRGERPRFLTRQQKLLHSSVRVSAIQRHSIIYRINAESTSKVMSVATSRPADLPHTVIVVPCYNEARRLDTRAFTQFRLNGHWVEFLFVNDGSRDETLDLLERLRCASPDTIRVKDQQPNRGKAEAVRTGMLEALDGGAEFVGYWDADLATPLRELPKFLEVFERRAVVNAVLGSRVKLLGRSIQRHAWRHYLGRVFATLVSEMLRLEVYDTQCGAKLFRSTPELRRALAAPFSTAWLFDVEILARLIGESSKGTAAVARYLYELPLDEWRDVPGSKLTRAAYARAATSIFRLYLTYGGMLARQSRASEAVDVQLPA
jgi:dolichyl-phosphate beta-glucosyltransferase